MATHTQLIQNQYDRFVMKTYPRADIALVSGSGCRVRDAEGKAYLDFAAGIGVTNLGHSHPNVTKAVAQQAATLVHCSNLFMNEKQPELAEKLIATAFDGVCFFANSGAEVNEGMIKFARKFGSAQGRHEIIVMEESFHGRTLATLAATGRKKYREGFAPDVQGFVHVPYNDIAAVERAISPKTVAILLEAVQGEGGILPADPVYLKQLRELCDKQGLLLMFDEVQCGMGRTGKFWAWQHAGIEPDAFSSAKALANGLPMGVFMVQRKHENVLTPGTHASTFGGTPLVSAAALAVLDTMHADKLVERAETMGKYLTDKLSSLIPDFPMVQSVRGLGLMIGVVLDRPASALLPLLRDKGLIALPAGETVLRLLPPLIITEKDADEAVAIIRSVLETLKPTP